MTNLIDILKKETETLKIEFIELTKQYASDQFDIYSEYTYDTIKNKFFYIDKWNRKSINKEGLKIYSMASIMKSMGKDKYVSKEIEYAIDHYDISIVKLASRISKKMVNIDNATFETTTIGRNINTKIVCGDTIINAYTIIASGEIQRPHYRYLVSITKNK